MLDHDFIYILNSYQARNAKSKIIIADKEIINFILSSNDYIPAYDFKRFLNNKILKQAPNHAICLCYNYFWIELPFDLGGVMFSPREYKKYLSTELKKLPLMIAKGGYYKLSKKGKKYGK